MLDNMVDDEIYVFLLVVYFVSSGKQQLSMERLIHASIALFLRRSFHRMVVSCIVIAVLCLCSYPRVFFLQVHCLGKFDAFMALTAVPKVELAISHCT